MVLTVLSPYVNFGAVCLLYNPIASPQVYYAQCGLVAPRWLRSLALDNPKESDPLLDPMRETRVMPQCVTRALIPGS